VLAAIAMAGVVSIALFRSAVNGLRGRLRQEARSHARGELIVIHPATMGRGGGQADAIAAMFKTVEGAMARWELKVTDERAIKRKGRGLSRTYVRLLIAQGAEDDAIWALDVAAWKYGLPRGRYGVLAVTSPTIASARPPDPPGEIKFTQAYEEAKRRIGVDDASAEGVKILIVDLDRPDEQYLPADADVTILDPSSLSITHGHATLVTAIVADIATGAEITTLSVGDAYSPDGFWAFLDVLISEQDADLIVASLAAPGGGRSKDGRGRDNVFDSLFRSRVSYADQPPAIFPTGNYDPREPAERIDTIAIPARFETVVAIGACSESGARSAGSRYGVKAGDDPHAWWMAPGGSFDGLSDPVPFVRMGNRPQAGTSVANAIAAGLMACAMGSFRDRQPPPDSEFDAAVKLVRSRLLARPVADRSLALLAGLADVHSGRSLSLAKLIAELELLSYPHGIDGYNPREHGRGMLHLDPPR